MTVYVCIDCDVVIVDTAWLRRAQQSPPPAYCNEYVIIHAGSAPHTCRLVAKAEVLLPPVRACMCSISRPPSDNDAVLPLMPLVISSAGRTMSIARMPVMTRFMVRSGHGDIKQVT